jgi:hypothetical protein
VILRQDQINLEVLTELTDNSAENEARNSLARQVLRPRTFVVKALGCCNIERGLTSQSTVRARGGKD